MDTSEYCREIETYLCRKNDGHLIRVVGPSFELVSRWATDGVPLKIAFRGIDRCFERYYRRGPRRRPVRIDFCEADVLDVFDEWRRAVGLPAGPTPGGESAAADQAEDARRRPSLALHLERAMLRLTTARTSGLVGPSADALIDRVCRELEAARAAGRGVRGAARVSMTDRLALLDAELIAVAHGTLDEAERRALEREATEELVPFRDRMPAAVYDRAHEAAVTRLVRERFGLPTLRPSP